MRKAFGVGVLAVFLLLVGCGGGGGGGDGGDGTAPVNVAGTWSNFTLVNGNTAMTSGCSDPALNGLTASETISDCRFGIEAFDLQGSPSGPTIPVTQSDNTFTIPRINYVCLDRQNLSVVDSAGFMSGSGTVSGNTLLDIQIELEDHEFVVSGTNVQDTGNVVGIERDFATGSVSGTTITLDLIRTEFTPTDFGTSQFGLQAVSCNFSPAARFTTSVTQ